MKVSEVAAAVGGRLSGDGEVEVKGVAALEEAGEASLSYLADLRQSDKIVESRASAFIVPEGGSAGGRPCIIVDNPLLAFSSVVELFHPKPAPKGVLPGAHVAEGVKLGKDVTIHPNTYVGEEAVLGDRVTLYPGVYLGAGSEVGDDCTFYPNAVVMDGTKIGNGVILHGGVVIGCDGYGFVWDGESHRKIPQVGRVVIEDDVEIGANSTVDRATLSETVVGKGTKIDNLVQVAHNCKIGEHVILVSQSGLAGSVEVGNNVVLAGHVGVAGHLKIGDGAIVGAKSGVTKDVEKGAKVSGYPLLPHMEWMRLQKTIMKLPEMRKTIQALTARLEKLEEREENDV